MKIEQIKKLLFIKFTAFLLLSQFANAQTLRVVVQEGDPLPGGCVVDSVSLVSPSINDRGEILFRSRIDPGSGDVGLYLLSGSQIRKIIQTDDPLPDDPLPGDLVGVLRRAR